MADDRPAARARTLDVLKAVSSRPGLSFRVLIGPPDGVTDLFLGEGVVEPGTVIPLHEHLVTEAVVVLEGSLTLVVGEQSVEIGAGQSLAFPAGVPHALANRGATAARFLATAPWDHATYSEATTYYTADRDTA